MARKSGSLLVIVISVGVILLIVGLTYGNYWLANELRSGNHFASSWAGARYWVKEGLSPYDERIGEWVYPAGRVSGKDFVISHLNITIPYENEAAPIVFRIGVDFAPYLYPMTTMLAMVPFGLLDFPIARAIWMTILEVGLILLVLASIRLTRWQMGWFQALLLVLFSLLWYHGVRSVLDGQIGVLSALFFVVSLVFVFNNQDIPAGVTLAFSTLKPTMVFLVLPFVLLWAISKRRRDVVSSFLVTIVLTLLATVILVPSWPLEWLQRMFQFSSSTPGLNSLLMMVADTMPGIYLPVNLFIHGIFLIYLVIEWVIAMGKDEQWFLWTAMMTIVVGNIAGYKAGISNYVLFIPVLFLILKSWEHRWQGGGKYLSAAVLLLLGAGIWGFIYLSDAALLGTPAWVFFPVPVVCLVGLWWVRWWFIRPKNLFLETLAKNI